MCCVIIRTALNFVIACRKFIRNNHVSMLIFSGEITCQEINSIDNMRNNPVSMLVLQVEINIQEIHSIDNP